MMDPPEGRKIATMDQRNSNPYPEDVAVLYATSDHGWITSLCDMCWSNNDRVQFAVPESYQFPNDTPEQQAESETVMMIERVPPEGYKTAPMDQRNRNPYPESIMVMYATSEHTWMQSSCSTCWVDNDTVQFAVPESYQFPNDKPEQASPVDTFMAPNGRTSANEQRFMDDDHPAAPKTCTINLNQQAMLFDWCREHKDDERTFEELAVQAIMDLMFPVTRAVLKNHWAAVNGKRRVKVTGGTLIGRIEALEATVASMRHHFNVAGLLTRPLPTAPENRDVNANTPQEES